MGIELTGCFAPCPGAPTWICCDYTRRHTFPASYLNADLRLPGRFLLKYKAPPPLRTSLPMPTLPVSELTKEDREALFAFAASLHRAQLALTASGVLLATLGQQLTFQRRGV